MYQDLVDWPNGTDSLNTHYNGTPATARCCKDNYVPPKSNVSTAINAHTAQAHRRLADLARWIGKPPATAQRLDKLADGVVAGIMRELQTSACEPAAPSCFVDGLGVDHTGVHGALYVAGCHLLSPSDTLKLLPFLKAKAVPFPVFSVRDRADWIRKGIFLTSCK